MKRVNSVLIAVFIAASAMFVSCDEEEKDPFIDLEITPVGGQRRVHHDGDVISTHDEGTVLNVKVTFNGGSSRLSAVSAIGSITGITGATFDYVDQEGLGEGFLVLAPRTVGPEEFEITVLSQELRVVFSATNNQDPATRTDLTITVRPAKVVEPPPPADGYRFEYTDRTLGAQNATGGSFLSATAAAKTVMNISTANTSQATVDFAYYHGAQNRATIAAPINADAGTITYGTIRMSSWNTRNTTIFVPLPATATVSNPGTWWEEQVVNREFPGANATSTHANQLAAGQGYAFLTTGGYRGAFFVSSVNGATTSGSISIRLIDRIVVPGGGSTP
jgi:hypothetical protein